MQIYTSYANGRLTLYFHGELDHHEAHSTMQSIDRLLDEYMPRDCVLELSELKFMDSSGIAIILKTHKRLRDAGGRAWIENAASQPMKVIDASGIERIIKITANKEA